MYRLIALAVLVSAAVCPAAVIQVPGDATTIQAGIGLAADGDTVLVNPGTYSERIDFQGRDIVVASRYCIIPDASLISTTVLDGNLSGVVVTFANGETAAAKLIGFTIRNGYTDDPGHGGGICCLDAGPTISDNIIADNLACYGGGIYCLRAQPVVTRNRILRNRTQHDFGTWTGWTDGPGIFCDTGSNAVITANVIAGNRGANGGGIYAFSSSPVIEGNTITLDTAIVFGGGIFCNGSQAIIRGNTVTLNHLWGYMGGHGGGIACDNFSGTLDYNIVAGNSLGPYSDTSAGGGLYFHASDAILRNNTVAGNIVPCAFGGGIDIDSSTLRIVNTIIWGDTSHIGNEISSDFMAPLSITFSDIEGGWPGEKNFDADPLFCPDGSYRLQINSPCIGAGQNDGDVGAGGIGCYLCGDVNGDWAVNTGDAVYIVNYIFRNGPPPASPGMVDPNCSGTWTVGDAVYIVAYIFRDGPIPCAGCP